MDPITYKLIQCINNKTLFPAKSRTKSEKLDFDVHSHQKLTAQLSIFKGPAHLLKICPQTTQDDVEHERDTVVPHQSISSPLAN